MDIQLSLAATHRTPDRPNGLLVHVLIVLLLLLTVLLRGVLQMHLDECFCDEVVLELEEPGILGARLCLLSTISCVEDCTQLTLSTTFCIFESFWLVQERRMSRYFSHRLMMCS
jgi:hypothetical protein